MHGCGFGCHDDRRIMLVVIKCDLYLVMHQPPFLTVDLCSSEIIIENSRLGYEGICVTSWAKVRGQIGTIHATR